MFGTFIKHLVAFNVGFIWGIFMGGYTNLPFYVVGISLTILYIIAFYIKAVSCYTSTCLTDSIYKDNTDSP